ncbi:MAG: TonB-dependent receptor, partial [Rikenellaceae bacterium]
MKGSKKSTFNGAITLSYTYRNVIFKNQTNVSIDKGFESPYGVFKDYANMNPYFKPYDSKDKITKYYTDIDGAKIYNPLYTELINNFSIEFTIIDALKVRAQFGISKKTSMSDKFYPADHTKFLASTYQGDGYFRKGSYTYGVGEVFNYNANVTVSYAKTWREKHQLYAGFDYSIGENSNYNYRFMMEGFSNENLDFIGNALQYEQSGKPYGYEDLSRRIGFTGNVNYTFNNRYYVDLSLRMDGSSQFGSKNKFAPFWSAGIGWNIHRENFLKESNAINNLRLKVSYGQTGSQQFNAYQALSTFKYISGEKYINWNGAELMGHGNENLKWQVTDNLNVGTEIGMFNNRISAEFDYYNKKTSNLLSNMNVPYATGFGYYVDNVGEVKNIGFETGLKGYIIRNPKNNVSWLIAGKLSYNKNKITKLSESIKTQNEIYKYQDVDINKLFEEGRPQNSLYAVRSLGIDPSTGEEVFLDRYGEITNEWYSSAKVYLGSEEPLYRGNISTLISYKNFTLNLS